MTFQDWYYFPLLAYSMTDTRYDKLVYSHTHTQTYRRAGMLVLLYPSPLGIAAVTLLIVYSLVTHLTTLFIPVTIDLFIPVIDFSVYTSHK